MFFPGGKERPRRDADPSLLLVPWSRKGRATSLLPPRAVRPAQSLSACTMVHFTLLPINTVAHAYNYSISKHLPQLNTFLNVCVTWPCSSLRSKLISSRVCKSYESKPTDIKHFFTYQPEGQHNGQYLKRKIPRQLTGERSLPMTPATCYRKGHWYPRAVTRVDRWKTQAATTSKPSLSIKHKLLRFISHYVMSDKKDTVSALW
jgi:hypothetical protein